MRKFRKRDSFSHSALVKGRMEAKKPYARAKPLAFPAAAVLGSNYPDFRIVASEDSSWSL